MDTLSPVAGSNSPLFLASSQYYDSMGGTGYHYTRALLRWLRDEHEAKKGVNFDDTGWEVVPSEEGTPQQTNGIDCGVFTCMFASYLSEDLPLQFGQADMNAIRHKLAWQIVHTQLE
jgi:sentrin-specific protease 1